MGFGVVKTVELKTMLKVLFVCTSLRSNSSEGVQYPGM